MGKTLLNIQVLYDKMGKAEKKVANFLIENPQKFLSLSIKQLATVCECGEATITRFSKRLGFEGFPQLKLALAKDVKVPEPFQKITADDSAYNVFSKVCNDIYSSLEKTRNSLNKQTLNDFCNVLLKVKRIYIFGLGNSASVSLDASHKLSRLGLQAIAVNDNHMQAIMASHTDKDCLVWGISHSGKSKDIIQALQIAKSNGAITACLTDKGKSPIFKVSDYVLTTLSDETNYRILGLSSRIAGLAIIDTVYSYLACHIENGKLIMSETEKALVDKKI